MRKSRKRKDKEVEATDMAQAQKPSKKSRGVTSGAAREASELDAQAVLPSRTRKGASVSTPEARKAAAELAASVVIPQKGRVKTVSQKPPRARKLILSEEEEDAAEEGQMPLVETLKQLSPEKLVEVAKLSENLQKKTTEEFAEIVKDKTAEESDKAGASELVHESGNTQTNTESLNPLSLKIHPPQMTTNPYHKFSKQPNPH